MHTLQRLFMVFLSVMSMTVFAHEQHTRWDQLNAQLCKQLESAVGWYEKNNFKQARTEALMAYFDSYENQILPSARSVLGQAAIVEREQQFKQFAQMLSPSHADGEQLCHIKKQAAELCAAVSSDVETFKKNNIQPKNPF